MQCIPKSKVLQHHPDTLIVVRKECNLDKPGSMEDSIRIIREWVLQQKHFKKKDFSDVYLDTLIMTCKGSLERAKTRLDRICTLRTLLPQYFEVRNAKTDFGTLFDAVTSVMLPKLTPDHYRVWLLKPYKNANLIKDYFNYYTSATLMADYMMIHEYCRGFIAIIDFTEVNIMDCLPNLDALMLRQILSIFIEGYGIRIKGVHIYSPSKLIEVFVKLIKQMVSPKIADRVHTYKTLDNLIDIVPADILPKEYGGKEKPLRSILDDWLDVLSSEEHLNYLEDLKQAGTDESCRQTDKFNEEYAGMPGTFRMLTVD